MSEPTAIAADAASAAVAPAKLSLGSDPVKEKELRTMKARATFMLVAVAALYVVMKITTDSEGWSGYVEAFAEAAMVGGLADWFAVTALFRHPLRLRIPHTAIIPNRKDQIGESLGDFVQSNFLSGDLIAERLDGLHAGQRLGEWMSQPENARKLGDQTTAALSGVTEMLRDEDVAAGLEQAVIDRLDHIALTPLVGRAIDIAIEGNHHQTAVDAALAGMDRMLVENRAALRQQISEESPWWVPETLDDAVFDKLITGIGNLLQKVQADPDHQFRSHVDRRVRSLAVELRDDPELIAKGEELKAELLNHPEVRAWFSSLWAHLKAGLLEASDDPNSELRQKLEAALVQGGENLQSDPKLQKKIDDWAESVARYAVDQSKDEVSGMIAGTVARWDAEQTSSLIETQVGRDLQFIRINGTVVGGLAGLVIHAIGDLLL